MTSHRYLGDVEPFSRTRAKPISLLDRPTLEISLIGESNHSDYLLTAGEVQVEQVSQTIGLSMSVIVLGLLESEISRVTRFICVSCIMKVDDMPISRFRSTWRVLNKVETFLRNARLAFSARAR